MRRNIHLSSVNDITEAAEGWYLYLGREAWMVMFFKPSLTPDYFYKYSGNKLAEKFIPVDEVNIERLWLIGTNECKNPLVEDLHRLLET